MTWIKRPHLFKTKINKEQNLKHTSKRRLKTLDKRILCDERPKFFSEPNKHWVWVDNKQCTILTDLFWKGSKFNGLSIISITREFDHPSVKLAIFSKNRSNRRLCVFFGTLDRWNINLIVLMVVDCDCFFFGIPFGDFI